jgi:hypothetical protein
MQFSILRYRAYLKMPEGIHGFYEQQMSTLSAKVAILPESSARAAGPAWIGRIWELGKDLSPLAGAEIL